MLQVRGIVRFQMIGRFTMTVRVGSEVGEDVVSSPRFGLDALSNVNYFSTWFGSAGNDCVNFAVVVESRRVSTMSSTRMAA